MQLRKALLIISFLTLIGGTANVQAQCPMCRTAVESARTEGSKKGEGLNTGILYLLSLPYLTVIVVGGIWYTKRKKAKNENAI